MGGIISKKKKKETPEIAEQAKEPNPSRASGTSAGAARGGSSSELVSPSVNGKAWSHNHDDYGAKFRFPLRKEPTITQIAAAFKVCTTGIILWVDCNDNDYNRNIVTKLQSQGVKVDRYFSTASAVESLRTCQAYQVLPPSKFRVVTNRVRPHDDGIENAWLVFAKECRSLGYNGPILLFHSVAGASQIDQQAAMDLNVVPTSNPDHAIDFMSFKSHVNSRFPINHMFPHFETLNHEGVASKVVKGAEEDVLSVLDFMCDKCKISSQQRAILRHDLVASEYVKHYLPRSCINLTNSTLASCIFRHVESLVMHYTVLNFDPTGSSPRVERVIAIENSHLRARFERALAAKEAAAAANPKSFFFPPGINEHLHVLRMQLPNIPSHINARPCLVFHATSDSAEKLISAVGFRKDFMASATGLQKFGAGIYFSTFPMYSSQYQKYNRDSKGKVGDICFLACWVILGHPFLKKRSETEIGNACGLEAGYDSHYALVRQGNSIFDQHGNAAMEPDGDEIVIFEPDHILPQFVIEMNMVGGASV